MVIALRIYLVLIFLANLGGMAALAAGLDRITAAYPLLTTGLVALLFACGVASLTAVVLMWRWRRAGVYLIVVAYTVMLFANLSYEAPLAHTLLGPVGLAVLLGLVWPVRNRFAEEGE
jgi:hypothetical protein